MIACRRAFTIASGSRPLRREQARRFDEDAAGRAHELIAGLAELIESFNRGRDHRFVECFLECLYLLRDAFPQALIEARCIVTAGIKI